MKKQTKALSGPSLNRFFRRFFRAQPNLDPHTADQLAKVATRTISSVRLRRLNWAKIRQHRAISSTANAHQDKSPKAAEPTAAASPQPVPAAAPDEKKFDPYAFGLIPIYQREGRDGLLEKLAEINFADHLRKMARAQQIALPSELRNGDIDLEELRAAIANAVEKRMADRRAAAG